MERHDELPLRLGLWLAGAAALGATYLPLGHLAQGGAPLEVPRLALERELPLFAWALVPYASVYPVSLVVAALPAPRSRAYRLAAAYLLALAAAAAAFLLVPTTVPRDRALAGGADALAAFEELWRVDPPTNALPSLHLAVGTLVALYAAAGRGAAGRRGRAAAGLAGGASTVLTGQHALLDGAAGIALAAAAWAAAGKLREFAARRA